MLDLLLRKKINVGFPQKRKNCSQWLDTNMTYMLPQSSGNALYWKTKGLHKVPKALFLLLILKHEANWNIYKTTDPI